jgi:hypothetical protein
MLGREAEALTAEEQYLGIFSNDQRAMRTRVFLLANLGREHEAREAYHRYAALPGKKIDNLVDYRAYLSRTYSSDPATDAWIERAVAGMRKAGMPEQ